MARYAAFLRGVNLGPRRRASSADLRTAFEDFGFTDVATFRSSGNVVFEAGRAAAPALARRIEQRLEESLGFDVTVFLRAASEVRAIVAHEPFEPGRVEAAQGKLQVVLLGAKPGAAARREVLAAAGDEDRLAFGARELYWLPSGGIRDSRLDFAAIEQRIGPTTTRTKGTIGELARKFFGA